METLAGVLLDFVLASAFSPPCLIFAAVSVLERISTTLLPLAWPWKWCFRDKKSRCCYLWRWQRLRDFWRNRFRTRGAEQKFFPLLSFGHVLFQVALDRLDLWSFGQFFEIVGRLFELLVSTWIFQKLFFSNRLWNINKFSLKFDILPKSRRISFWISSSDFGFSFLIFCWSLSERRDMILKEQI